MNNPRSHVAQRQPSIVKVPKRKSSVVIIKDEDGKMLGWRHASNKGALQGTQNLTDKQRKRLSYKGEPNDIAVRELHLYADNDAELYRQQREPIEKNLDKKWEKGAYDREKAVLAYLNLVDNASRKYRKEFASYPSSQKIFTKADKVKVAKEMEEDFYNSSYRQER